MSAQVLPLQRNTVCLPEEVWEPNYNYDFGQGRVVINAIEELSSLKEITSNTEIIVWCDFSDETKEVLQLLLTNPPCQISGAILLDGGFPFIEKEKGLPEEFMFLKKLYIVDCYISVWEQKPYLFENYRGKLIPLPTANPHENLSKEKRCPGCPIFWLKQCKDVHSYHDCSIYQKVLSHKLPQGEVPVWTPREPAPRNMEKEFIYVTGVNKNGLVGLLVNIERMSKIPNSHLYVILDKDCTPYLATLNKFCEDKKHAVSIKFANDDLSYESERYSKVLGFPPACYFYLFAPKIYPHLTHAIQIDASDFLMIEDTYSIDRVKEITKDKAIIGSHAWWADEWKDQIGKSLAGCWLLINYGNLKIAPIEEHEGAILPGDEGVINSLVSKNLTGFIEIEANKYGLYQNAETKFYHFGGDRNQKKCYQKGYFFDRFQKKYRATLGKVLLDTRASKIVNELYHQKEEKE